MSRRGESNQPRSMERDCRSLNDQLGGVHWSRAELPSRNCLVLVKKPVSPRCKPTAQPRSNPAACLSPFRLGWHARTALCAADVSRQNHRSTRISDTNLTQTSYLSDTRALCSRDARLALLVQAMRTNFDDLKLHTDLLLAAERWSPASNDRGLTLRGASLTNAGNWIARARRASGRLVSKADTAPRRVLPRQHRCEKLASRLRCG